MIRRLTIERLNLALAQVSNKARSDFVYTGAAQGVGLASSFLTALLITNYLGLEQLGAYALILSISTFVAALAEVGIGQTATRYASVSKANSDTTKCNEVLAWSINVRLFFSFVTALGGTYSASWLGTHVWPGSTSSEFIPHAFVLGALTILQQCANAFYYTHHNFRTLSLLTFLNSALILGGAFVLAWVELLSLESVVYTSMAAALVTFFVIILKTPWRSIYAVDESQRRYKFRLRLQVSAESSGPVDGAYGINPQNFAIYLLVSSLIVTVFTRLDIWLIGALLSETEVGIYKLASYFAIPLALVVTALNTTIWPRASKLISQAMISGFIRKTLQVSLLLTLPMSFYIVSLNWLPNVIFPNYATAIEGLAIVLCIRYILSTLITPVTIVGYSLGMSRVYVVVNFFQLTAIFLINFLFINKIGLFAPALALVASEIIGVLILWPILRNRVRSLDIG